MFQNRMLRRIFGPNRKEGTDEWRKLHMNNEDIYNEYSPPNIIRTIKLRIRWAANMRSKHK
jgi:hypothetical protein